MRFPKSLTTKAPAVFLALSLSLSVLAAPALAANIPGGTQSAPGTAETQSKQADPVVITQASPVRGVYQPDSATYRFLGVPYATVPGYFMDAQELPKSETVFNAASYGAISPQANLFSAPGVLTYSAASNNCLNLNVWTPGINDGQTAKRPIIVWLHGGGLSKGYSRSSDTDGSNLASSSNAVVISVNHRLNVFGFLNLSDCGDKYQHSQNQGIRDLILALKYIKANAAVFGGDPENITLMGQSGGGIKILALLSAPEAQGLFQRAIIQSATTEQYDAKFHSPELSRQIAQNVLGRLGLTAETVDEIQSLPLETIQTAANQALIDTAQQNNIPRPTATTYALGWTPVFDNDVITADPVVTGFPDWTDKIPLLIGSNLVEWNSFNYPANLTGRQHQVLAGAAPYVRGAYPDIPINAWSVDTRFRSNAIAIATAKSKQSAPVYNYIWACCGGYTHGVEIPYIFKNLTSLIATNRAMSTMSSALWASFAATGKPSCTGINDWPSFTEQTHNTMILNLQPRLGVNHDTALLQALSDF